MQHGLKSVQVKIDKIDRVLDLTANALLLSLIFFPQLAYAQSAYPGEFGGITSMLKSFVQIFIFDWGYYIGIITLAIQGYRWKTGRIDLMQLGSWALGISLVFFAPNIVAGFKARSAGSIQ